MFLQLVELVGSSLIAKLVASTITYPHEVLRARIQDGRRNFREGNHVFKVVQEVVQKEGVAALWSGVKVNAIRTIPATILSFVSYEYFSRYLTNHFANNN